jgi:hypothetical protein
MWKNFISSIIAVIIVGCGIANANEYQYWVPVVSYQTQYVPVVVQVPVIQHYALPVYVYQPIVYEYRPWFSCFRKQQHQYWINQSAPPAVIYPYNIVKY